MAATQYPDDLIWSKADKPVLEDSHEYVLQGQMVNGLCEYTYPDVNLASPEMGWEVHDIAVSPSTCTKVVLEGSPKPSSKGAPSSESGDFASTAALERNSRFQQQIWWEDIAGIAVTWTRTRISWWWDGSCALGGSTYRYYDMFEQSGWYLVSGSKSSSSSCSQYVGNSWATFRNTQFCSVEPGWTAPVDVYVYSNKVIGKYNGGVSYSNSTTHSASCAGLFLHRTSGTW